MILCNEAKGLDKTSKRSSISCNFYGVLLGRYKLGIRVEGYEMVLGYIKNHV